MTDLKRLVLGFRTGEIVVRCLYRTKSSTSLTMKARTREVRELAALKEMLPTDSSTASMLPSGTVWKRTRDGRSCAGRGQSKGASE